MNFDTKSMLSIRERIHHELSALKEYDLLRTLKAPKGHDFSSNDYFSLAKDRRIIAAVKRGVERYGYGSTSSRFIRGERAIYHTVQRALAAFCQSERALLFSSGYNANIGVLTSLIGKGDVVFSDRLNHASIIDGLRLSGADIVVFPHLDVNFLFEAIKRTPHRPKFLVSESLFSMDGDIAPLDAYAELARRYDLGLIVDEAHAIGVYGEQGGGLIEQFGVRDMVLCSVNGLGKAFGCFGAFAAASEEVIELIIQRARTLMYTTALPPLALCAIEQALSIVKHGHRQRAALQTNMWHWHSALPLKRSIPTPIIPVILKDNRRALQAAFELEQNGFDVRAIRPPSVPENTARLRITTNIAQTPELINEFLGHLQAFL